MFVVIFICNIQSLAGISANSMLVVLTEDSPDEGMYHVCNYTRICTHFL